jgi:hypothetical protein
MNVDRIQHHRLNEGAGQRVPPLENVPAIPRRDKTRKQRRKERRDKMRAAPPPATRTSCLGNALLNDIKHGLRPYGPHEAHAAACPSCRRKLAKAKDAGEQAWRSARQNRAPRKN